MARLANSAKKTVHLRVSGMSCGHCEGRVVKALHAVPGVTSATASAANQRASIDHNGAVAAADLIGAIELAGFGAEQAGGADAPTDADADPEPQPRPESRADPPAVVVAPPAFTATLAMVVGSAANAATSADYRLRIHGMTCAACVRAVEQALLAVSDVQTASVSLVLEQARVVGPRSIAVADLVAAVASAGYSAAPVGPSVAQYHSSAPHNSSAVSAGLVEQTESTSPVAAGWCLAVGVATMVASLPLMQHAHHADPLEQALMAIAEPVRSVLPQLWQVDAAVLRWTLFALCTSVVLLPARQFFVAALHSVRRQTTDMNTLVALGVGAAWIMCLVGTITPQTFDSQGLGAQVWYDAVPWVPGFVLLGRWLEGRARAMTRQGLDALLRLQPRLATLVQPDRDVQVAVQQLQVGDRIRVASGAQVPTDGVIEHGSSAVDESMMTGESLPIARSVGDRVLGGTAVVDGSLVVLVTKVGAETALAAIIAGIEGALLAKPKLQRIADRVAAAFTPFVLGFALLAAAIWLIAAADHSWGAALVVAVSVVIVACPCAMGLAVPTAVMVATGSAARRGLLIRNGVVLERAGQVSAVVFDKTGTLTSGHPQVTNQQWWGADSVAGWLAVRALCSVSTHPLARALASHLAKNAADEPLPVTVAAHATAGRGVAAQVDGVGWRMGAWPWIAAQAALDLQTESVRSAIVTAQASPGSLVFVAADQAIVGYFQLQDSPRLSAAPTIAALHARGITTWLASGDRAANVHPLATEFGVQHAKGDLLPEDKVAIVQGLRAQGHVVAVVGDGVNDGPALASADVAVAIGDGSAVAAGQADIVLLRPDLTAVVDAIDLAQATDRILRQNLAWALGYNVLAMPLAAGALYPWTHSLPSPMLASVAMALSSVCVVGNSLRLRTWRRVDFG
ncbi:MAG: heavy metal translocating P-type ATPase [Myxococcales bacterium]|nr:heavy metal translocating P-type ATPase [Myxococcales bacterium]